MNKLFKNIVFIALILGVISCKQDKLLDVLPYDSFTDATAFSSKARCELSVLGVYDAAQSGFYASGQVRGYPFGAASFSQGDMRGEDMLNQALFFQITYENTYSSGSANNVYMWHTLYGLINKANLVIEGLQTAGNSGVLSTADANKLIGECRFLRAMAHHELCIHFSRPYAEPNALGIVYRDFGIKDQATTERAKSLSRETVVSNYQKILADLDFAEANLPSDRQNIRAGKVAAIALKMRVKSHMGDWTGVKTEGAKLINVANPSQSLIGGYKLTATPDGPFANNTSEEAVFSINNNNVDNSGPNGALASMYGSPSLGGRGLVRVSPIAYNLPEWRCDDLRRGMLVKETSGARSYYTTKFRDYVNRTDLTPHIRFAEVVLMLAEAESRSSNSTSDNALALLNAVRNRAVTAAANQYKLSNFATSKDLTKAILAERRIEFLAEGKRWSDIHRLALDPDFSTNGIPAKMAFASATLSSYVCEVPVDTLRKSIPALPYSNFRFIWPIPQEETVVNPNIAQNPMY
ncbi:MAG: RagB/SusD family nutrient uptake outer membrane protein [Saprospiraceae bacterium]|jgi:hypothetical protein|nr:RagB/SusD family nutrient uptake outer membrane protein [Saprospiraceae bacterium]